MLVSEHCATVSVSNPIRNMTSMFCQICQVSLDDVMSKMSLGKKESSSLLETKQYQLTVVYVDGAPYHGVPDQHKINAAIRADLQTAVEG